VIARVAVKARAEHHRLFEQVSVARYPAIYYCASYQDGLIHSLDFLVAASRGGHLTHPPALRGKITTYQVQRTEHLRARRYNDVSYLDGFLTGLLLPLTPPRDWKYLPFYYLFGAKEDIRTIGRLRQLLPRAETFHKRAMAALRKRMPVYVEADGALEPHHMPWL
jgi:hypothetical protein